MQNIKLEYRLEKVKEIAEKHNWLFLCHQENINMVSFYDHNSTRINIYLTTMTVGTCLNHPLKGKTQLFRKYINYEELEKIFINPRVHTKKGYYNK